MNGTEQEKTPTNHLETKECPFEGCDWEREYDAEDYAEEMAAEADAESHYHTRHGGKARIRIVLDREISTDHLRELQEIVDDEHDDMAERGDILGYEVAYAYGEWEVEPDEMEENDER